jgi:hypothetical protein
VAHSCPHDGTSSFGCSRRYAHLKAVAMRGGALTEDERAFVGTTVHWHDTSGGWRQPDTAAHEIGSILSPEDTKLPQALMKAGSTERVEFLA